jgi:hypothetical protein
MDMVNKCSVRRSSFKGGSGALVWRLEMNLVRTEDLLVLGVMNIVRFLKDDDPIDTLPIDHTLAQLKGHMFKDGNALSFFNQSIMMQLLE